MALVPLSTIRLHFGRSGSTSREDDDLWESLEAQAVAWISTKSGWDLEGAVAATDYYNGTGTNSLALRGVPDLDETFTLEERDGDDWDEISSTDYTVITEAYGARARLLYLTDGFKQGEINYRVTSTRGYTSTTCPLLLQRAILDLMALWYRQRTEATPTSLSDSASSSLAGAAMPPSVAAWLEATATKPEPVFLPPLARM